MGPVVDPDSSGTNVVAEPDLSELDTHLRLHAYRICSNYGEHSAYSA